jgi:hypothetical protein
MRTEDDYVPWIEKWVVFIPVSYLEDREFETRPADRLILLRVYGFPQSVQENVRIVP